MTRTLAVIWEHAEWGTEEQCGEAQKSGAAVDNDVAYSCYFVRV